MEGEISPSDIKTNPKLIKAAQEDIGKLDILVCGICHDVFHFIEEFQVHKEPNNCNGSSNIKENNQENKPQVWAFLLWKNAQHKDSESENENSWTIYQRWCKVEASAKEAWIVAAKSVQSFSKLSAAKMQEVRTHKTMIAKHKISPNASGPLNSTADASNADLKDEPLEEGEIRLSDLTEEERKYAKIESHSMDEDDPLGGSDLDSESELDTEEELEKQEELAALKKAHLQRQAAKNMQKKLITKPVLKSVTPPKSAQLNNSNTNDTVKKLQPIVVTSRKAIRTRVDETKMEDEYKEFDVMQILAKRYNPRKKTFEYLIHWDGMKDGGKTWEPTAHLDGCKQLLEIFERNLARQKERKAAEQAALKLANKTPAKPVAVTPPSTSASLTASGRPQRTSKQKAMNQVKAWCGDIVDNDENGMKRRSDSDSEDEVVEKRMRLHVDPENEENATPHKQNYTVHRIIKQTVGGRAAPGGGSVINGVNKKQDGGGGGGLPLVMTNKGATTTIKVDQKQVPGLSKGVYIMNQETGIVKLDSRGVVQTSAAGGQPRILKGGGNTIVRVAPKVTQMRVVQKGDEGTGSPPMRLSPGMSTSTVQKQIVRRPGPGRPPLKSPAAKIVQTTTKQQVLNRAAVGAPTARILSKTQKPVQKPVVTQSTITKIPLITPSPPEDDSDDGLGNEEDLFPKDLPLPPPDSPPRDFTLCPLTGKVLAPGQTPGKIVPVETAETVANDSLEALVKTVTEGGDNQSEDAATDDSTNMSLLAEGTNAAAGSTATDENAVTAVTLDGETPLMITGDDGVVYQVAGQNEQGQTLLVAQGADGQQQCMLVTTEQDDGSEGVLTLDTAVAEAVAQIGDGGNSVEQPLSIDTGTEESEMDADGDDGQVMAEIVKTEPPSPGGTRKVVLLMPDGNLIMTSVDAEHYASLDLDDK